MYNIFQAILYFNLKNTISRNFKMVSQYKLKQIYAKILIFNSILTLFKINFQLNKFHLNKNHLPNLMKY